jgi:hypothetical protein
LQSSHLGVWRSHGVRSKMSFAAIAIFAAFMASTPCGGGELRPYELPSQKVIPFQQQAPVYQQTYPFRPRQIVPPARERSVDPAVYLRFREAIQGISETERDELARTFEAKREVARRAGQLQEAEHYERLLHILAEP